MKKLFKSILQYFQTEELNEVETILKAHDLRISRKPTPEDNVYKTYPKRGWEFSITPSDGDMYWVRASFFGAFNKGTKKLGMHHTNMLNTYISNHLAKNPW